VIHQQHPWSAPLLLSSELRNLARAVSPKACRAASTSSARFWNPIWTDHLVSSFRNIARSPERAHFLLLGLGPCETENLFSISSPVKMLLFASICPCHNFKKSHQQGFFKSPFGVKFPRSQKSTRPQVTPMAG
jgi:hypothetical protein